MQIFLFVSQLRLMQASAKTSIFQRLKTVLFGQEDFY